MYLHNDKEVFKDFVADVAHYFSLREYQIEKDYYVSLLLKTISTHKDLQIVFKGGTSLSKSFQLIDRFSEDIDITLFTSEAKVNDRIKRQLKELILKSINESEMTLTNPDDVRSRREFNAYKVQFEQLFQSEGDAVPHIIIETIVAYKPYPIVEKEVNNFITRYLIENNRIDIVNAYELKPFKMAIQSLERTFLDKIFALCDYHLSNTYERYSRHLYDLHMIWTSGQLDMKIISQITQNVIKDRQQYGERNKSCMPGARPNEILEEIIKDSVYEKDFLKVTERLIYKPVLYKQCIQSLNEITKSGLIPEIIRLLPL